MANCRTLPEQVLKNTEDIKRLIEQGTIDAADLLTLLTGDETIIVDLAESGQQVEIHLDQHFRQSLATKIDLVGKLNADTVYSNDDPAFADAMEQVTDLNTFYQFFYDRRKEPSKIYLIQGQVGITFDNVLTALGFPAVIGEHKWALQCECLSSEAGGFFIKMTLTTDNHQILYTNTIGGWLSGQTIGKWKDMKKSNEVVANPTLSGSEPELTGLQVGDTKYKMSSGGAGWVQATKDEIMQKLNDRTHDYLFNLRISSQTLRIGVFNCISYRYTDFQYYLNYSEGDYNGFKNIYLSINRTSHYIVMYKLTYTKSDNSIKWEEVESNFENELSSKGHYYMIIK